MLEAKACRAQSDQAHKCEGSLDVPILQDARDMEMFEDLIDGLWEDALKREPLGMHGTLFYYNEDRRCPGPAVKVRSRLG